MKATAISDTTGAWETVECDGLGRAPAGYHAPTAGERWVSRRDGLRSEAAKLRAQGRLVEAEQVERTLADMGAA